jgi:hypothetical protein
MQSALSGYLGETKGGHMMSLCQTCKYAVWDYETYYGGDRQYFIEGCKKALDEPEGDECEEYEEDTEEMD